MEYKSIQVSKLTPTIGAEISGVDLRKPISDEQFSEVMSAFLENQAIFFREQDLTVEQLATFARRIGPLHIYHGIQGASVPGFPEVMQMRADEKSAIVFGEPWHQDATADEEPPLATLLHLHKLPENGGGDTMFSSGYAAYESLSEPVKKMLEGLKAVHELGPANTAYFTKREQSNGNVTTPSPTVIPQVAVHPVVHTHPLTGRKTLFVNKIFTRQIVGMSPLESQAVLGLLFQQIEQDEFKCRFKWTSNSLAMWDNRVAYHRAIWDYYPQSRYGHRVTVLGGGQPA